MASAALFILVAWLLMAALPLWPAPVALAQENGDQPYEVEAGPYRLEVLASPSNLSLGTIQYLVRVRNARNGQPVPDARVRINGRHAESGEAGWANALNSPRAPADYTAQVELDTPGVWDMSVDVSSDLGRVAVEVPSQTVPEPRQSGVGGLVFAGVFVALIVGGAYLVWTIRRAQQKREAHNAG